MNMICMYILTSLTLVLSQGVGVDNINFVIFHVDDLGYGDLNTFGHPNTMTPNIDKLYEDNGIKFTQAIAPDSVCSPNRAAFITSRYPIRTGFAHDIARVLLDPRQPAHLPFDQKTFGTELQKKNFSTALFGKWHLGLNIDKYDDGKGLPTNYGFDYYYGVPFGMNPNSHPDNPQSLVSTLYEYDKLIQQPLYMYNFTTDMTNKIIDYIDINERNNKNMLIYVNYLQVHTPLFASEPYRCSTARGEFGDDLLELDSSVGKIIEYMKLKQLDDNTLYILLSDGGPYPGSINGGSSGMLKGNKGQTWDGGHRIPLIMRYNRLFNNPGTNRIYSGTISTMDIYPTMLRLAGISYDEDELDGIDLTPILFNNNKHIERILFHYCGERVLAMRMYPYKIHFYTHVWDDVDKQSCRDLANNMELGLCGCTDMNVVEHNRPLVYNIEEDPEEKFPLRTYGYGYRTILNEAEHLLEEHVKSIVPVENQLIKYADPTLEPCCNYPICCCNHDTC